MSDSLQVSTDGLRTASAELIGGANQAIIATTTSGATSGKPSSEGITHAAASIAAFGRAYQGRMQDHANSAGVAAASYTHTDANASDDITRTV